MGDRGNIKVYFEGEGNRPVYLYSHWGGSDLYRIAKDVLSRRQRWDYAPYLARMLFCEMVKGQESDETGFGISPFICDNEHTIIGVNCELQEVTFENEDGSLKGKMSLEQFVTKKDKHSKE